MFIAVRYPTHYTLKGLKVNAGKIMGDVLLPPSTPMGNSFIYLPRAARKSAAESSVAAQREARAEMEGGQNGETGTPIHEAPVI